MVIWLLLWYASILTSMITFAFGISERSWLYMLVSTTTLLPLAYYFLGANSALKYVGFIPLVPLCMTIFFWWYSSKCKTA